MYFFTSKLFQFHQWCIGNLKMPYCSFNLHDASSYNLLNDNVVDLIKRSLEILIPSWMWVLARRVRATSWRINRGVWCLATCLNAREQWTTPMWKILSFMRAWESVSLDVVSRNDQIKKMY
jgi:hypothetical protein